MRKIYLGVTCCIVCLLVVHPLKAQTDTTSFRVISKEYIQRTGAINLSELLRYELNLEVEQFPLDGGSRIRSLDLNSRYCKILVNGIPVGGSDMFGGHVDLGGLPLHNAEKILISHQPAGVLYGSGAFTGTINIITNTKRDSVNTALRAFVQEESIASEYNLRKGAAAKGRHILQLGIRQSLSENISVHAHVLRNEFKGHWGEYNGKSVFEGPSFERGYSWSPYKSWNIDAGLSFHKKGFAVIYDFSRYYSDLTYFGHLAEQEFEGGTALDQYAAIDYRYNNHRNRHHLHANGNIWKNAKMEFDLSYQDGSTRRRIDKINTGTNQLIENQNDAKLHSIKTLFARLSLLKPLHRNIQWHTGIELENTKGFIGVAPGTFQSREINRTVNNIAGFTFFRFPLREKIILQPGIRLSSNGLSELVPAASIDIVYKPGTAGELSLQLSQVQRFPNHREMFTELENEFNLLKGNEKLEPERGNAIFLTWRQQQLKIMNTAVQWQFQSGFRVLSNRIMIAPAPRIIPTQESFQYTNSNKYLSWLNTVSVSCHQNGLNIDAGVSLVGLKGNDIADAGQYDKFLFHAETNAGIGYSFKGFWLQANHHFTGKQSFYSFERQQTDSELTRVHNQSPAFHILDLNAGIKVYRELFQVSAGVRNLFNEKEIVFRSTDGRDHYTGDLRTRYAGYGVSYYLRFQFSIQ